MERRLREAGHPWRVVNAGISGKTSSGALTRIYWVLTLKPDIVVLVTGALSAGYPAVARRHDLILVPFFLEGVAGRANLNQDDGIHPTAQGYRVVVDTVLPLVVRTIKNTKKNKSPKHTTYYVAQFGFTVIITQPGGAS